MPTALYCDNAGGTPSSLLYSTVLLKMKIYQPYCNVLYLLRWSYTIPTVLYYNTDGAAPPSRLHCTVLIRVDLTTPSILYCTTASGAPPSLLHCRGFSGVHQNLVNIKNENPV